MAITLYDLSVPTFLQTTRAVANILTCATRHCTENGIDPDDFVTARLHSDMAPFHFQIEAMKNHALCGLTAAMTGTFSPPPLVGEMPFSSLQAMVGQAVTTLETMEPDKVNRSSGRQLDIDIYRPVDPENASTSAWASRTLAFTAETFLLSYSLPNFYFHAVTVYDILRMRGVPIGKGDYEGQLRIRAA